MALRAKKPEKTEKRLKLMLFGVAGAGKTMAALQFPKPYLIDTEKGAVNDQYVDALSKAGGVRFETADFEEMLAEVTSLLADKHPYKTVIFDPITVVYADLLDKAAKKVGTDFGRHYGEADKRMRHLINLLLRLDMNVVVTAHAKKVYGDGMVVLGDTFDGYKKLDYLFDLVIEVAKRGKDRVGIVRKTRIEKFGEGDVFPFNYAEVASRYGRDVLERDAAPEMLASPEQVAELTRLVAAISVAPEVVEKWLERAGAESFKEMPSASAQACIDWCKKRVVGDGKEAA